MNVSNPQHFPPQTGEYKVVVKNGGGWAQFDTCRLAISVGQKQHEDEKLRATFAWAGQRFKKIIISVNDTLQRHNLMAAGIDAKRAHDMACAAGDAWLERNAAALSLMPVYTIERWDQWLQHPGYAGARKQVQCLYENHTGFRCDIDTTAQLFLQRRGTPKQHSIDYLLEETAVMALQQQAANAVDVYPGSIMQIWDRFKTERIQDAPEGLESRHFTRIDFLRAKPAV